MSEPHPLESAVRILARIFAEELARAFQRAETPPAPVETPPKPVEAQPRPVEAPQKASPPPFGLRPPDAIGDDEVFGSALRFLEERAGEVRAVFGAPVSPPPPEPSLGEMFSMGRPLPPQSSTFKKEV